MSNGDGLDREPVLCKDCSLMWGCHFTTEHPVVCAWYKGKPCSVLESLANLGGSP